VTSNRIDPRERARALRAEAAELRILAAAAVNTSVRRLLDLEAFDREDQAQALEDWLANGENRSGS
jgi:hypothetical protein